MQRRRGVERGIDVKAEVRRSFTKTTTIREQRPRSHHKGATDANATGSKGRVRTGDRQHLVLCLCQLGQDIPSRCTSRQRGPLNQAQPGLFSQYEQIFVAFHFL